MKMEKAKTSPTPGLAEPEPDDSPPLSFEGAQTYRSGAGLCIYISYDRWDIQREVQLIVRKLANPNEHDWKRLVKLTRYLKGTPEFGVQLLRPDRKSRPHELLLEMYSDTDFGGCKQTRRSTVCGACFVDGSPFYCFTRRLGVMTTTAAETEIYGASMVASDGKLMRSVLTCLGYAVDSRLYVDRSAAKAMIQRDGVGKLKHLDMRAHWLQQEHQQGCFRVFKEPGDRNPADFGTKLTPSSVSEVCARDVVLSTARKVPGERAWQYDRSPMCKRISFHWKFEQSSFQNSWWDVLCGASRLGFVATGKFVSSTHGPAYN